VNARVKCHERSKRKEPGVQIDRALFPLPVRIERRGPLGIVELAELAGARLHHSKSPSHQAGRPRIGNAPSTRPPRDRSIIRAEEHPSTQGTGQLFAPKSVIGKRKVGLALSSLATIDLSPVRFVLSPVRFVVVSRQVTKLGGLGLVMRQKSADDARVSRVAITKKGQTITDALDAARERLARGTFAKWRFG
jgi:hypothetical protein